MGLPKWDKAEWKRNGSALILTVLAIILIPGFLERTGGGGVFLLLVLTAVAIIDWIYFKKNPFLGPERNPAWTNFLLIALAILYGLKMFG